MIKAKQGTDHKTIYESGPTPMAKCVQLEDDR
jgi:hypothetical protein